MSVDFFNTTCKEAEINNTTFGICDNQDGTKAFTDIENKEKWIASVSNKNGITIAFTPIDNCLQIFKPKTNDLESTCDGMLTFTDNIYLVELKRQRTSGWIPDAIGQLKNTIKLITESQDISHIKYKKAYACNKKHPSFKAIDNELSKKFFTETNGFRLDINSEINIK